MNQLQHILNNYFDNIYVLYIDNDELNKITPKLQKRSIKVQFFEGVNGYKITERYSLYVKNFNTVNKLNPNAKLLNCGSYGHILSFINILKDARTKNYKKILILEPDIYFSEDFDKQCIKYLSMDYNMLYFGASQNMYYREETWDIIEKSSINELKKGYYFAHNTLGTFALAINSTMYNDCIDALIKMEAPTDVSFIKLQTKYKNKCIVCYPNIICCDLTHSKTSTTKHQIDSMKNLRWNIKYDFEDDYNFKTENNCWYEIEIDVNSYFGNFTIKIFDNLKKIIFPELNNISFKHFYVNKKITIYYVSKSNTTTIKLNNIFVDDIKIKKINRNYIRMKVPTDLIKKMRETDIGKYYVTTIL
jgi:GR25 family glycosyltransferase involved in LPS biosynthesis